MLSTNYNENGAMKKCMVLILVLFIINSDMNGSIIGAILQPWSNMSPRGTPVQWCNRPPLWFG
jgi:hypothetical protein